MRGLIELYRLEVCSYRSLRASIGHGDSDASCEISSEPMFLVRLGLRVRHTSDILVGIWMTSGA